MSAILNRLFRLEEINGHGGGAEFSLDRTYRYALWRHLGGLPGAVMFIGLNPSTADETEDDPTIRRCKGFAQRWGYSQLIMTNLFALRATDPGEMLRHPHPVGGFTDHWLLGLARKCDRIIAAWGTHGDHRGRASEVRQLLRDYPILCLGQTKDGHPRHPLYLRADCEPEGWGW